MIKCPYCGAPPADLTLDVDVRLSCKILYDGSYFLNPCWEYKQINDQIHECSPDDMKVFCSKCGHEFIKVDLDENDKLILLKANDSGDKNE